MRQGLRLSPSSVSPLLCARRPRPHCLRSPAIRAAAKRSPSPSSRPGSPTPSCGQGSLMKVAVINFYGNVGKTTIARHLLAPRIDGAELIAVESINADEGQGHALRGKQFGELQEYLQTVQIGRASCRERV